MADKTLDAKGLNCPLPILKARKALKEVPAGGTVYRFLIKHTAA
jgi:tRNA 2-thiouridine synthesizing protein A